MRREGSANWVASGARTERDRSGGQARREIRGGRRTAGVKADNGPILLWGRDRGGGRAVRPIMRAWAFCRGAADGPSLVRVASSRLVEVRTGTLQAGVPRQRVSGARRRGWPRGNGD
jgi:hypothetical protein